MGVDQIVRGDDLLGSTARQLALYDALGYPRPTECAHVPLALDAIGARLAKREAAAGLDALRAAGRTAEEIVGALAASCGLWPEATPATPAQVLSGVRSGEVHARAIGNRTVRSGRDCLPE